MFLAALTSLTLAHHAPDSPYGWHIACDRYHQRAIEIQMDPTLDDRTKWQLKNYLKQKLEFPQLCLKRVPV